MIVKESSSYVSNYISKIKMKTGGGHKYVFRGEQKKYNTSCSPNIFRNKNFELQNFEKNIIEKMKASGFDQDRNSYLLTAIEAQHGGFPSRLLDITYNLLIALHFAVTPHYTKPENSLDGEDGVIFIIKVENMYIPSSKQVQDFYELELLNTNSLYNRLPIFKSHFIMLDFYHKNPRIIAQQGGFIMFCGNEAKKLPNYLVEEIIIPKNEKPLIREELKKFFNVSNAFVYPESNNSAELFNSEVAKYSQANLMDFDNELSVIFGRVKQQFYTYQSRIKKYLVRESEIINTKFIIELIIEIEVLFKEYFAELFESRNILLNIAEIEDKKSEINSLKSYLSYGEKFYKSEVEALNEIMEFHSIAKYEVVKGAYNDEC